MMLRFFRPDDPEHRKASEALPWLLNGTLEDVERQRVERHVAECVRCRRELGSLRVLQAAVISDEHDAAIADALTRLRRRLDELEAGRAARFWRALSEGWHGSRPWLPGLIAAQAVLALVLAGALSNVGSGPALYRTLGDASPLTQGGVVVVFRAEATSDHIGKLLLRLKARVVDGPNSAGAYTLQIPAGERASALALLRADPMITFAEPMPGRR